MQSSSAAPPSPLRMLTAFWTLHPTSVSCYPSNTSPVPYQLAWTFNSVTLCQIHPPILLNPTSADYKLFHNFLQSVEQNSGLEQKNSSACPIKPGTAIPANCITLFLHLPFLSPASVLLSLCAWTSSGACHFLKLMHFQHASSSLQFTLHAQLKSLFTDP